MSNYIEGDLLGDGEEEIFIENSGTPEVNMIIIF